MLIILKWEVQSSIVIFVIVSENHPSVWRFGTLCRSFAMECEHQQPELQCPDVISLLQVKLHLELCQEHCCDCCQRAACVDRLESALFLSPRFR